MEVNTVTRAEVPMIKLESVKKSYAPGVDAVNQISLAINKGEFVFVVGNSGSGKSTLIKLLLKEVEPTSGSIMISGKEITGMKHKKIPYLRRSMGVVFQDFRLLNDRNVYENVALAQRLIGVSKRYLKKNVDEILSMVGLSDKSRVYPNDLSGGEQQRVALARAMVNRPQILLADEPTGNLDPNNAWSIMELLNEINRMGTTVLVVTHNTEVVDTMQKRVITLQRGVMIHDDRKGGYVHERR